MLDGLHGRGVVISFKRINDNIMASIILKPEIIKAEDRVRRSDERVCCEKERAVIRTGPGEVGILQGRKFGDPVQVS